MQTINVPLSFSCYASLNGNAPAHLFENLNRFSMKLWTATFPEVLHEYKLSTVPGALTMVDVALEDNVALQLQQTAEKYNIIKAELARWCLAKNLD